MILSYLKVTIIIVLNCLKLSVYTGLGRFMTRLVINRFQTAWNPTLYIIVNSLNPGDAYMC